MKSISRSERAKSRKECKTNDGGVSRRQRPHKAESYPISCQLPLRMTLVPVCQLSEYDRLVYLVRLGGIAAEQRTLLNVQLV